MKMLACKIFSATLLAAILAGCGAPGKQESAMEWMARQPDFTR